MKKSSIFFWCTILVFFAAGCSQRNSNTAEEKRVSGRVMSEEKEGEEQDGIKEAQEVEFEMTKDLSLGYIPKFRMINAINDLMIARRNGSVNKMSALTWTERGPNTETIGPSNGNTRGTQAASDAVTSGRMRAIWTDLTNPAIVWVGGIDGGLWKTNDITSTSAAAWSLVNDFFSNLAVSSICQDPTNTDIMYFGTGEKTYNIDAVRGGGVWKSTDHGVNWTLLTNTTGFYNVSKVLCDAAGNVYVATIGANGIQRSVDGGANWTNITPTGLSSNVTEMRISTTGRIHIVCGYLEASAAVAGHRFSDNPSTVTAATWTTPTTTYPTQYNVELAVAGNTLYALPSDANDRTPAIYKSTDGGANWATTAFSPPGGATEPTINAGQGWYDLAIGCDPSNPDIVIAGGLNFYRSTDGGATAWTQITRWVGTALNYVHADHHTVVWNGTQVLVGTDGGIFYSNDNGTTFTDRNDGLRLKQFYSGAMHPTTTNYFIGGTQDNGTHQLTSPGLGASVEVIGGDGGFTHIDQDEPQYQFSAFTNSNYIRSVDGGNNWSTIGIGNFGYFINPTDYDDVNNRMYTSGGGGQFIRWEDPTSGGSFTIVPVGTFSGGGARSITVSPYTNNRVFFGLHNGRIVRVDNANENSPTATNITGSGMDASSVSNIAVGTTDNNLLATFSNYGSVHVWVTTSGGGAGGWTDISGTGLPDIPVWWAMFHPEDNTKAILATEMGVYETDLINGSSTVWTQNVSFPVVRTDMLQYRKSDGAVLAATHGRGMWTSVIPLTTPYVRFATPHITRPDMTSVTTGCRNYTDYTVNMNIDIPPTGNANVTINIAGGSTATQGVDFDFTTNGNFTTPSNILTFPTGSSTPQPITIRIYNEANPESLESFTLNYSIGGGTNAQAAPSSPSFTFYIIDNDLPPAIATIATIGTNNANINQPFRGQFSDAKTRMVFLASELSAAGFNAGLIHSIALNVTTKASTAPYNDLTIKMKNSTTSGLYGGAAFETSITQVYGPVNYSTVAGVNTFNLTTPFTWDGVSNLIIEICYDNVTGTLSDNVAATTATPRCDYDRQNGVAGCALTVANFSFGGGGARPVVTFSIGSPVETVLNNNRAEHVPDNGAYYFFTNTGVINRLNASSASLGCVTSNIFEAGNTWQTFSGGQRSQKVIEVTPTTNPGASYEASFYFTAAELGGKPPASLKLAKTTAATMAGANSSNTVIVPTTFASFGSDFVFTGSFTGFSKFFLVDNNVVLPVTLLDFKGRLEGKTIPLDWSTSMESKSSHFDIEKSTDGINFVFIGKTFAAGNSTSPRNYSFIDRQVFEYNYYRLKIVDIDAKFVYSSTILIRNPNATQDIFVNNPFRNYIDIRLAKMPQKSIRAVLLNMSGAKVYSKEFGASDQIRLDLSGISLSAATYLLQLSVDGKTFTRKMIKE